MSVRRGAVVAVVAAVLSMTVAAGCARDHTPATLHFDGDDRLLVDERDDGRDGWQMTSGSLFVEGGHGWTGSPNHGRPDGDPRGTTNSAVFRLRSARDDLEDVDIAVRFRVASFLDGGESYDGVHLWLRYRSPDDLYAVSVMRRDGTTLVKRKSANGYRTIGACRSIPTDHEWHSARATATTSASGVRLRLWVDRQRVCDLVDRDDPLRSGRVGVRTDDAEVFLDELKVTER